MKIEIKNVFGDVLHIAEIADGTPSYAQMRKAVEAASLSRTNLSGANLIGAYLIGANLSGANLSGANLSGADLSGANLSRAYLIGADLSGANLSDANLSGADLSGANLSGANLIGANLSGANLSGATLKDKSIISDDRFVMQIGPLGSRESTLIVFRTLQGYRVQTGCFFGTDTDFLAAVAETHGENKYATDYRAAMAFAVASLGAIEPQQVAA